MADTPLHFFKVVLSQTLEDKNLRIPEKFVRKFGDELSDVAMLRVPNGRVWHVGLTKDGNKICFDDGWHDFVKNHSICVGYFLVFKYGRNSNFDVLILDTTCCEIQYPYNGENNKSQLQREVKSEDDVEITDSRTPNPSLSSLKKKDIAKRTRSASKMYPSSLKQNQGKPSSQSAPVTNKRRKCAASLGNPTLEHGIQTRMQKKCKMEKLMEINESDAEEKEEYTLLEEMGITVSRRFGSYPSIERARLINAAKSFKPKGPSFMTILRSKGIDKRTVFMPLKFATKYLSREVKFIKLQVQGGREWWFVHISWRQYGGPIMRTTCSTWKELSNEKMLEKGDVCLFELIRKKDHLMKLSVYPCKSL